MHPARRLTPLLLPLLLLAACERPLAPAARPELATAPAAHLVTIPAQGTSSSLDIANWNVEWFGDAANGPSNESLQQSNVRDVIAGTDADIWGLEEVVDRTAWNNLLAGLPGYAGILANDSTVVNGPQYYSDFSNTEQKVALVYKTSIVTVKSAQIILTGSDYDFAGRPPMEVKLTANVNGTPEDLVVIVLHMKAGSDNTSWQRRQNASNALKSYLDTTYPTQKVMVIGDWNDDTDKSITLPKESPYLNFVNDSADYTFPTKALSDAGVNSEVNYSDFIDHQLATNDQLADYIAGSAEVYRVDQYISSYGTTTSDHYPVLSRWTIPGGNGNLAPTASFTGSCTYLDCTFTDQSSDADGSIASWSWSFGDNTTSSAQNPAHSYAAAGTYTVKLTVTDNGGATSTSTQSVTVNAQPSGITLSTRGYKSKGSAKVDLTWSGATGSTVDVYRNNAKIATPSNSESYTDTLGRVSGTFTYKVCNTGTTTCSNASSVTF